MGIGYNQICDAPLEVYYSVDVEADGPIPGPFSMVSIGVCICGQYDGRRFQSFDVEKETFYRELQPISEGWDPDALAISGLTREHLLANGDDPAVAMTELVKWVKKTCRGRRAVFAAYPLGFDWMWTYWYMMNFVKTSPFGYSTAFDMKSFYAAKSGAMVADALKRLMPEEIESPRPYTHNALVDAQSQGEMCQNLFKRYGKIKDTKGRLTIDTAPPRETDTSSDGQNVDQVPVVEPSPNDSE